MDKLVGSKRAFVNGLRDNFVGSTDNKIELF